MVMHKFMKRFRRDEEGAVLVEALLSMPIIMLMTIAMVECAMLLFQWNLTVKALQIGARLAAVSDPVVGAAAYDTLTTDYNTSGPNGGALTPGDPVPSGIVTVSCGYGTTACDATQLNRLVTGGDACGVVASGGPSGICDVARFIQPENLLITYSRAGLGYVGRPFGVVTTITVELREQYFDFIFLDKLLPNFLGRITIPAHPVSITSEDLTDCNPTCP